MSMNKTQRKMVRGIAVFLAAYLAALFGAYRYVGHHHPQGVMLYLCAALPWAMICGFIAATGRYLYEERDGYRREIAMRCLLWGAAGAMATNIFVMVLHSFGWHGQAPGPLEICVFAAASGVARISYEASNRPECGPREQKQ
jgi:peptidoglycan/LPS O-acetylase OafA/YrhL